MGRTMIQVRNSHSVGVTRTRKPVAAGKVYVAGLLLVALFVLLLPSGPARWDRQSRAPGRSEQQQLVVGAPIPPPAAPVPLPIPGEQADQRHGNDGENAGSGESATRPPTSAAPPAVAAPQPQPQPQPASPLDKEAPPARRSPLDIAQTIAARHAAAVANAGQSASSNSGGAFAPWAVTLPPLIHMTWKDENVPDRLAGLQRIWRELNPAHTLLLWTDADIDELVVRHFPQLLGLFRALPKGVLRADLFRYMVLYQFGGVYSDMDTKCLKPIASWVPETLAPTMDVPAVTGNVSESNSTAPQMLHVPMEIGLIAGVESDLERDWERYTLVRQIQITQWTIAGAAGHPVLGELVHEAAARLRSRGWDAEGGKWRGISNADILEMTGPGLMTDVVLRYLGRFGDASFRGLHNMMEPRRFGDAILLPVTGFSPETTLQPNSRPNSDPQSKVQHLFYGSWKK